MEKHGDCVKKLKPWRIQLYSGIGIGKLSAESPLSWSTLLASIIDKSFVKPTFSCFTLKTVKPRLRLISCKTEFQAKGRQEISSSPPDSITLSTWSPQSLRYSRPQTETASKITSVASTRALQITTHTQKHV